MIIISENLNVGDYYFDVFLSISETLTGFSANQLQATGLAETYYRYILCNLQAATFIEFLTVSKSVFENSFSEDQLKNAIASEIMADPGLKDIAGKVITVWYLGTWEGTYVNELSYKEGLIWNVMHAHPPGAKQPGFKSWEFKPVNSN